MPTIHCRNHEGQKTVAIVECPRCHWPSFCPACARCWREDNGFCKAEFRAEIVDRLLDEREGEGKAQRVALHARA